MACVNFVEQITIYQGEDRDLELHLFNECDEKFALGTPDEIEAKFKNDDDTFLVKTLGSGVTIIDAPNGKIKVELTALETADLRLGEEQDFDVNITIASKVQKSRFEKALNVRETDVS